MVEIGNTLREARRARGLTLEEVEEETKIRKKYIMAMEMEQFEILPGPIYAKAFLKNYAKFLNINLNEIMDAFKQKQGVVETVHEEHNKPVPEKKLAAKRKPPYLLYAAAVLLIAAVAVTLVYGAGVLWKNNAAVQEKEPQNGQIAAGDPAQQQVPDQGNTADITGVKVDLNVVSSRSWIQVIVDGKQAFQGELASGETRSFEGEEKIVITLGNAGAVEVLENGKSLGFLGAMGAVVEHEFKAPAS